MLQWLIVYARQEYFKSDNSKADDIHNKGANVFIIKHFLMPSNVVSTGKRRHLAAVLRKLKFYLEEMTAVSSFALSARPFIFSAHSPLLYWLVHSPLHVRIAATFACKVSECEKFLPLDVILPGLTLPT